MKKKTNKKGEKMLIFFLGDDPLNIDLIFTILFDYSPDDKTSIQQSLSEKKDFETIESILTHGRSGKELRQIKSILKKEKLVIEQSKKVVVEFVECDKGCQACSLFREYLTTQSMRIVPLLKKQESKPLKTRNVMETIMSIIIVDDKKELPIGLVFIAMMPFSGRSRSIDEDTSNRLIKSSLEAEHNNPDTFFTVLQHETKKEAFDAITGSEKEEISMLIRESERIEVRFLPESETKKLLSEYEDRCAFYQYGF